MSRHTLSLGFSLIMASCSGDEKVDCNPVLRTSVVVAVLDAAGESVSDAVVRYSLEGLSPQSCMARGDGTYGCAQEEQGRFVIAYSDWIRSPFRQHPIMIPAASDQGSGAFDR